MNSLNSTCSADTETVEDAQVNDNLKEMSDSDSAHPWPSPGNAAVSAVTQECDATEQWLTRRSSPLPGQGRSPRPPDNHPDNNTLEDQHNGRLLKEITYYHASTEDDTESDSDVAASSDIAEKLLGKTNTATVAEDNPPANADTATDAEETPPANAEDHRKDDDDLNILMGDSVSLTQ